MTRLIVSVPAQSLAETKACADRAWAAGADVVEVRMDAIAGDPRELAEYLRSHREHTWIVTCRPTSEGGHYAGSTADRLAALIAATRDTGAYLDFEYADWKRSSNIRQKVLLACTDPSTGDRRLILSSHDFEAMTPDAGALASDMHAAAPFAIVKIAAAATTAADIFPMLDAVHERAEPTVALAMGQAGLASRVLLKKLGGWATYCALSDDQTTAPGQFTIDEARRVYHWDRINPATRVFGLIGDPVAHSMSPLLLNQWFADAGIDAVYLPFRVCGGQEDLARFLTGCSDRPWLDVGGFGVTLPHKENALRWVGDGVDPDARRIGAINTICMAGEQVTGHNTDATASIDSICAALSCAPKDLAGSTVDVLGAGGAARAVVAALSVLDCCVTIYGRSESRTRQLADDFEAVPAKWDRRVDRQGRIVINATPVGMWPDVDATPMPAGSLARCDLVFDLIYHPLHTRLLKEAAVAGAKTLGGLDMFVRQAAGQFALWTKRSPNIALAGTLVAGEVNRRAL